MSISPQSGARGSKNCHLLKFVMFKNKKVDSLWGWTLPKMCIISKIDSNKSCWALNSVQKSQWAHMSIFPQKGASGGKQIAIFWNIIMFKNRVDSLWGWTLPKIRIMSKNALNEESHARGVFSCFLMCSKNYL